ncbi:MAG TPA: amidohydrolase family protein [Candidatus Dormibacteraeota bacterium]|nr:amidohydrolase family protein [Candidatus Dormibacteraeota bacterium]
MTNYWDRLGGAQSAGSYTINSGDTHVVEPRDLWATRLEKRFLEHAPRVERVGERDFWFVDDKRYMHTGHRAARWTPERYTGRYEDQRPGGMQPAEMLEDSDLDGVEANVLFPSVAITLYSIPDTALTTAIFRAYNDWLAEFCAHNPRRLKGVAVLLLPDDVGAAVAELERCVQMGFAGGLIPMLSSPQPTYEDPRYDPLWEAAQGLDVPLTMHTGGIRPPELEGGNVAATTAPPPSSVPLGYGRAAGNALARDNVTAMVFGRVFERYPRLKIGVLEMGTGWVPYYMRAMDRQQLVWRGDVPRPAGFADGFAPSDFVRRNVFFGYEDDDLGIRFRDYIGVDNLVYANDYPHPDCVWPRSRQVLELMLDGCSDEDKAKLAGGNAARIFRLA